MGKVRYHLRFQVIPGKEVKKDTMVLADFCLKHNIEEVVLFFAAEEWNNGLLSKKEEDIWFETIKEAKEILEAKGISVSLNPWMTVLHCERGRRFPEDRKFKPMVSPYGDKAKGIASFADKNWQKYIYNLYGRFATLGFRVIWIEDDFRYHNHTPLRWGGGFEDEMIERFSKKIGRKVKREDVVKKILQPGSPHPWRKKWMEVWREVQLEVARGIKESVIKNSQGKTKLGLMSSYPPMHSIEGRRWGLLFDALSIEGKVAHRPHFASYSEDLGRNRFASIMMLDIQKGLRGNLFEYEVAPEIENFPFTVWSKSDTSTWVDMALALFFGSDVLLLDLFPMVGNRADEEKGIGELLDRSYNSLNWISSRFSKDFNLFGIGIPWKEDAAEKVETEKGETMDELIVSPLSAWQIILSYGIPTSSQRQEVNVIFGKNGWIFDENEIMEMLKGGLLLDGVSARILCKRGFDKYLGVKYEKTLKREESTYSLEVVVDNKSGVRKGIYNSLNLMDEFNVFKPSGNTSIWTEVITPEKKVVGPGITLYENSMGGRVVVIPDYSSCRVLNFFRQTIMHNIIRFLYRDKVPFPLVSGGAYLFPMFFKNGKDENLVIFNGNTDPVFVNIETHSKKEPVDITILKPLENPCFAELLRINKKPCRWRSTIAIPYNSFLVVKF